MQLYIREIAILCKVYKLAVIDHKKYVASIQKGLDTELISRGFTALNAVEYKRTSFYCFQLAFAATVFSKLINRKIKIEERIATCFFGIGVLFQDELTDNPNYVYENFMHKMQGLEQDVLQNRYEWLTWHAYQKLIHFKNKEESFLAIIQEMEIAQAASRAQLNQHLSEDILFSIAANKGGSSLYFVRAILYPGAGEAEKKWIYQLGEVLQWTNDAFDIYKDHRDGIQSIFSDQTDFRHRRMIMEEKIAILKQDLFRLTIPKKNAQFIWDMFFCIIARGLVSLDQVQKLQHESGGIFRVENYTRTQLICDMEKPSNLLSLMRYMAKWK